MSNVVFSFVRYERLKAAQIRREKALAELWSPSNRYFFVNLELLQNPSVKNSTRTDQ
jgi:hypothetical protein